MSTLSATEEKWLKVAYPRDAAHIMMLPHELIRELYEDVFNYGPRFTRVMKLHARLKGIAKHHSSGDDLPPELSQLMSEMGTSNIMKFYSNCEMMDINDSIPDSVAVKNVMLNLHSLAREVYTVSRDGRFYVWEAPLQAIAGSEIYVGSGVRGFQKERLEIEKAVLRIIGLDTL